jgi:hypothetical protein
MEKTPFGRFSAGLQNLNRPAAVGGIPLFGRLATIFAGLELAGLLNWQRFAAKRPGYGSRSFGGPTSVHCHGMGPASGSTFKQKLPLILPLPRRRRKIK